MRKLTEEQKARSEEKKAEFKEVVKAVASMTRAHREELASKIMITNCEGHTLSAFNNCLIASQGGQSATIVGGFQQWLKQGRAVRKGEHGYAILFPREKKNGNGNGVEVTEEKADKPELYFLTGYVFDISQTMEVYNPDHSEVSNDYTGN